MKKLNSFYILKVDSKRLKNGGYSISLNLKDARVNGEVVRLGNSQLLETIRKIRGDFFDPNELERLEKELKLSRKKTTLFERSKHLSDLVDSTLFEKDLVSLKVDNVSHYKTIIKNGFYINGVKFVRLLSGAGNLRRNSVMCIRESLLKDVVDILDNGRNKETLLNPAKYNAYFGLYNSSGLRVSFPNFVVVPDYTFTRKEELDWIDLDDNVQTVLRDVEINAFDGAGIISERLSEKWAKELELDHIPGSYIFRAPFAKGQLVTFPVDKFIQSTGKYVVKDVWGNEQDLRFADIIMTESQLKLWQSYDSQIDYVMNCHKNSLGFFVTRVAPKSPPANTSANYMFLNALDLSEEDIEQITKPTLEHFWSLLGGDPYKMMVFFGGSVFSAEMTDETFESLSPIVKALIINSEIKNDPHILDVFLSALNKQIQESYLGKLFLEGNYSVIAPDPFALMEWAVGIEPNGLLDDGEHYHKFWINRGVKKVACGRSPLTHPSEVIIADIVNKKEFSTWYKHLDSVFVFPHNTLDYVLMADGDSDGDYSFSTSNPTFISGKQNKTPISYDKPSAPKVIIKEEDLWKSDISGFFSRVGWITNVSSSLYALKSIFSQGSPESEEIDRRLKLCRLFQGSEIDSTKLVSDSSLKRTIPETWVKWNKAEVDADDDSKKSVIFSNSILADKRPAYMRWLYPDYNREFKKELFVFDGISVPKFGIKMQYLILKENLSKEESELLDQYYKNSNFIHSDCVMNRISKHMMRRISIIRKNSRTMSRNYDFKILLSGDMVNVDSKTIKLAQSLIREYGTLKRQLRKKTSKFRSVEQLDLYIKSKALSEIPDVKTLVDACVIVCYNFPNYTKSFLWNVLGDELVNNLISRYSREVFVPKKQSYDFDFEFLYEKYVLNSYTIKDE